MNQIIHSHLATAGAHTRTHIIITSVADFRYLEVIIIIIIPFDDYTYDNGNTTYNVLVIVAYRCGLGDGH